jgi:hypothetical protein
MCVMAVHLQTATATSPRRWLTFAVGSDVGTAFISRVKVVACSTIKMKALRSFETSVVGITDWQHRLDSLKCRATHPMGRGLNTGRPEHEARYRLLHTQTQTHTHTHTTFFEVTPAAMFSARYALGLKT